MYISCLVHFSDATVPHGPPILAAITGLDFRILHSRLSFRFAAPLPLISYIQPFYNQQLPYSHVLRAACKPRRISNLRIHSVATEVYPCRKQKREQRVCASSVNPRLFSSLQPLSLSLPSFTSPSPLFSATYSLFSE